jgi:hypothetical protein
LRHQVRLLSRRGRARAAHLGRQHGARLNLCAPLERLLQFLQVSW